MQWETQELLAASVREVLAAPPDRVPDLLTELGWDDVVADEPAAATTMLFTEQGRQLARSAILDRVTLAALADDLQAPVGAVCYPTSGQPASADSPVTGVLLQSPLPGTLVAAPVRDNDGGHGLALLLADNLEVRQPSAFDPDLTWHRATGTPESVVPGVDWPAAAAAARRALSAELIGVSREALRLAVEHTSTRVQFGHPIAAFQAVRHRLAESHVAVTAAEAVLEAAWTDRGPTAAAAAKAQAGRAHATASRHAVQVCGAIGASLEHPLHRYVARGVALDALLGTSRTLISQLGHEVLTSGDTPRLVHI